MPCAALLGVDLLRQAASARTSTTRRPAPARSRADLADVGVDVDDRPGPARAHAGQERADAVVGAVEVGGQHRVPVVERQRLEAAPRHVDAGGVDEDVDLRRTAPAPPRPSRRRPPASLTSHGNGASRGGVGTGHRRRLGKRLSRRPTSATFHPSAANLSAMARPTPLPAPVTTATFMGAIYPHSFAFVRRGAAGAPVTHPRAGSATEPDRLQERLKLYETAGILRRTAFRTGLLRRHVGPAAIDAPDVVADACPDISPPRIAMAASHPPAPSAPPQVFQDYCFECHGTDKPKGDLEHRAPARAAVVGVGRRQLAGLGKGRRDARERHDAAEGGDALPVRRRARGGRGWIRDVAQGLRRRARRRSGTSDGPAPDERRVRLRDPRPHRRRRQGRHRLVERLGRRRRVSPTSATSSSCRTPASSAISKPRSRSRTTR